MKKIRNFLKGVKKELTHVKWPKKEDMIKFSIATFILMVFVGLFYTFFDVIMVFLAEYL